MREPHEGALRRLACGLRTGLAEDLCEFFVAVAHLDARDDRLALVGVQTLQRALILIQSLAADCLLERRSSTLVIQRVELVEIDGIGLSAFATQLVANAIQDGLAQIRQKRSDPAGLQSV